MKLQHLLLASLFSLAACGGGSKKAETTTPTETTPPPTETAAAPPPAEKAPPVEAPAPPPAPPRFALGEAKIIVKLVAKKKGASNAETVNGEITLAADGTLSATMTSGKKEKKSVAGKLTVMGELQDDKGDVIARIDDAGKVEARHEMEVKEDGKVMKSETKYEEVGSLDDTGVFTNKKDGKKFSIDDKGKVAGFPAEMQFTVTAAPEQRKAAMFVMIAMFAATKMSTDTSGSKASAVPAPAPKK